MSPSVLQLITDSGAHDDFRIDAKTGEIFLSGELDFDSRSQYLLEIVAFDGGEPSLTGRGRRIGAS